MISLSPRSIQQSIVEWLDARFGLVEAVEEAMLQRVPNYANAFYYCFGGMAFILFGFLILSGILLTFYYVPSAAEAWDSVNFIMNNVYLGWLIRGVHFWSANFMVVMVIIHMIRVYWTGSYRAPRELNWMVGVLLLLVVLGFAFTGYLLPWDEKAYWATNVGVKIAASTPIVGDFIARILYGSNDLTDATLNRFFAIHVFVLPAVAVLLMFIHFKLIRKHGISEPL